MTVMRLAAIGMCLALLGGAGGCVYYVGEGEGSSGGGSAVDQPPRPPDSTIPVEPAPPPDDIDQCTRLADSQVILDCNTEAGYQVDSWRAGEVGGTALHLVSVYETRSDHEADYHPEGEARVAFALPGSNVLALSAYEPTHWSVELVPGAALEKIVVVGYHAQRVTAPEGVPVEIHDNVSGESGLAACGYAYPDDGQGCDTNRLIAIIEELTNLPLASFDGCYHAATFHLASSSVCEAPAPAPSSSVIQDCAYDTTYTWRTEQPEGTALYLAGLYETRSDHAAGYHPEGEARVAFALPGSNVLALSAYEPTHWIVDVAPDAGLEKIVATGYHAQRVTAPEGVVVEIYDGTDATDRALSACGYAYPDDGQGCDTNQLIDNLQAVTGLRLTGFDGCYHATQLVYRP